MAELDREAERRRQCEAERKNELEEEDNDEEEEKVNTDNMDNMENANGTVLTPAAFDEIVQRQKSKEICVVSLSKRYWDLEPAVLGAVSGHVHGDEQLAHL